MRMLITGLFVLMIHNGDILASEGAGRSSPTVRQFQFDYGASIFRLPRGAMVDVWIPIPPTSHEQKVVDLDSELPAHATRGRDEKYGNQMLHFRLESPPAGSVEFRTSYRITRQEVNALTGGKKADGLSRREKKLLLEANAKVPIGGEPLALLEGVAMPKQPLKLARVLYDRVDGHVRYDKSKPGYGTGDAVWVCNSRYGNCTDFHSLFISLARSQRIPARFEIGFPLPAKRGKGSIAGYHCWAYFHAPGHGWIPVDISEADKHPKLKDYYFGNLTADRVTFSTGRDITLTPRQKSGPLNYFIYPHVEVNGKAWPAEQVELRFAYRDLP